MGFMGFLSEVSQELLISFGNILFNGFEFNVKEKDKKSRIPITFRHLMIINSWEKKEGSWIDKETNDQYNGDSCSEIQTKCAYAFVATLIQSAGLLLNLANRIGKLSVVAHLWVPSSECYNLEERTTEI